MQTHRNTHRTRLLAILPLAALLAGACSPDANGPSGPALLAHKQGGGGSGGGASSGFAVLANAAVTCTDGTIIGDVGTFLTAPPGAVTQTNCPVTGTVHVGDAAAVAAYNAFLSQYEALAPQMGDVCPIITGTLAGANLTPGTYCVSSEAKTGTLTLTGSASDTWLIKVPAGALTGTNFHVVLAGGAQACNVTWWVDAAATMTTSDFQGSILAGAAITTTGGTLNGNAWAGADGVGDVTFTGTTVAGCAAAGSSLCKISGNRVTGGGWIRLPSGAKGTFGVTGGIKHDAFWGHLEYTDHGSNGPRIKGTGVTAFSVINGVTGRIEGTAKVNRVAGFTYRVDVTDNGERGRNDVFAITIWDASGASVYSASGTLKGGNIQMHKARVRGCRDHDGDDDDDDDDNKHGH